MALIDINWNPSGKELRVFAILQLIFFSLVAWLFLGPSAAGVLVLISVILAVAGLIWPRGLRPIYVVWMALAFPIGWTVSHLLMGATFFLLMTPLGICMKLLRHDPLDRKFDKEAKTYWKRKAPAGDSRRYFRQY